MSPLKLLFSYILLGKPGFARFPPSLTPPSFQEAAMEAPSSDAGKHAVDTGDKFLSATLLRQFMLKGMFWIPEAFMTLF